MPTSDKDDLSNNNGTTCSPNFIPVSFSPPSITTASSIPPNNYVYNLEDYHLTPVPFAIYVYL